ncbi:hypothetical protein D3C76_1355150 [compost metagenome]
MVVVGEVDDLVFLKIIALAEHLPLAYATQFNLALLDQVTQLALAGLRALLDLGNAHGPPLGT